MTFPHWCFETLVVAPKSLPGNSSKNVFKKKKKEEILQTYSSVKEAKIKSTL